MEISRVTVSNFRGFRDEREIPFDSNVVILRGPNGSGKTSLVDAVQWLLLGDIPRLRASVLKNDEDYISNRYATGPPFVEVDLISGEEVVRVSRRGLGKTMQVQVDLAEETMVGDSAQEWLSAAVSGGGEAGHAEMLRRYLLQQDEMREFLSADTKERYEFVAALTGMEQLTRLDSQMTEELGTLRKNLREFESSVARVEDELNAAKASSSTARELIAERPGSRSGIRTSESAAAAILGPMGKGASSSAELLDLLESRSAALETLLEETRALSERETETQEQLANLPGVSASDLAQVKGELEASIAREESVARERAAAAKALEQARSRADKAQQLAALALEQIDGACPVCGQEHDVAATRAHLETLLSQAPELRDLTDQLDQIVERVGEAKDARLEQESAVASLEQIARDRNRAEESLTQIASVLESAIGRIAELVEPTQAPLSMEDALETGEARKRSFDQAARDLRGAIDAEERAQQTLRRARSLDQQVDSKGERLAALEGELGTRRRRVKRAERARSALGEMLTQVSSEVANTSTPLINEIYRRLEVHPTFREFRFRIQRHRESGHLRPWVYDRRRGEDGNAMNVLSAAQLNSLAICLFLALNLERETELATAILDDPVQSLDDLNLLSLADVLRTFRAQRQVVVSTHDDTLAELLIRKLRPLHPGDSTTVVTLDQWGEGGPRITSEKRNSSTLEPELELLKAPSA